jgi:alkyl hydroperoxide reductase subunit D
MTAWVDALIEQSIPDYAKDTKLNIDAVIKRSTLPVEEAEAVALAAAFATGNSKLWTWIDSQLANRTEAQAAQLRMNAISSSGGTTKERFEAYSLAASIVGKCHFCVKAHYDGLKKMGYSVEQLRDIGRIAAVITSVARVVAN